MTAFAEAILILTGVVESTAAITGLLDKNSFLHLLLAPGSNTSFSHELWCVSVLVFAAVAFIAAFNAIRHRSSGFSDSVLLGFLTYHIGISWALYQGIKIHLEALSPDDSLTQLSVSFPDTVIGWIKRIDPQVDTELLVVTPYDAYHLAIALHASMAVLTLIALLMSCETRPAQEKA